MPSSAPRAPRERLAQLIAAQPGQRLPSERDLAERFAIGRPALRLLLSDFESRGLIRRRHGSGTFAVDPQVPRLARVALLIDARIRLGDDPFFAVAVDALQHELQSQDAQCQLLRHAPGQALPPPGMLGDGAVLLGSACAELLGSWPDATAVVAWLIGPTRTLAGRASIIELEDEAAGAAAVAYHLAGGRTRLCFVGHDQHPSPRARLHGARRAAASAGISLELVSSGMNYEDGVRVAAGLAAAGVLSADPAHLGLIAANDWLAAGLHVGLARQGLSAGIIGFDGLPLAAALGLPSLAVPIASMASDTIAELSRLILRPGLAGRRLSYALRLQPAAPVRS